MSTPRPRPRPLPRPTMHADLPHKWLWCDNHSKVNTWYMNVPSRPRYSPFISSFVNTANRAWVKGIDSNAKLSDLDRTIIDCLLQDKIPADVMIATLQEYVDYIGGMKGELKQTGLIPWEDEAPNEQAIEKGVEELYNMIEKTEDKYYEAEAVRASSKGKGKSKNKGKGKGKAHTDANNKTQEDVEMQDADSEEQQTMPSLNDMSIEITAAGNAASAVKEKGKGKAPVKFGELPLVGPKKRDDDEEWKNFFLK